MENDLISRHAAIDTAMAELDGGTPYDIPRKIELLPAAQRWVPCSERLPENGGTVLVTDWGETDVGRRFDGRWWDCDGNKLKDVSAWMPFPEPAKLEDD